jgi:hypothetical protein
MCRELRAWLADLFFGSISYADIYQRVTGRQPRTRGFIGILDRLNTDI